MNAQVDYQRSVLNIRDDKLPFEIRICDAESHVCIFCNLHAKISSSNPSIPKRCDHFIDKESKQGILWSIDFYKRIEIFIDWTLPESSRNLEIQIKKKLSTKNLKFSTIKAKLKLLKIQKLRERSFKWCTFSSVS